MPQRNGGELGRPKSGGKPEEPALVRPTSRISLSGPNRRSARAGDHRRPPTSRSTLRVLPTSATLGSLERATDAPPATRGNVHHVVCGDCTGRYEVSLNHLANIVGSARRNHCLEHSPPPGRSRRGEVIDIAVPAVNRHSRGPSSAPSAPLVAERTGHRLPSSRPKLGKDLHLLADETPGRAGDTGPLMRAGVAPHWGGFALAMP